MVKDSLAKKEREEIFRLFLNKHKLKFNEIEKSLKIRSNMVAYHLEQMRKENLIEKNKEYYLLTKDAEKYIPIFSQLRGQELSPLPVILVAVMHNDKILLMKRNKRPYKDYWGMIGGKMHMDESFKEVSIRKVTEKSALETKFISINAVLHERVHDSSVKHSFILFFTKVNSEKIRFKETASGKLKWFDIKKLDKEKIIPSDYWLIKNKLNSKININSANMSDKNNKLCDFKILY